MLSCFIKTIASGSSYIIKIKYLLISILSILILVVGLTRIYLGVHYTSDVLGGYLLGIVYLLLFTYITDKYIKEK